MDSSLIRRVAALSAAIGLMAGCASSTASTSRAPASPTAPSTTTRPTTPSSGAAVPNSAAAETAGETTLAPTTTAAPKVETPAAAACPDGYPADVVCETVAVPVDPAKPDGPHLSLALTIRRANPTTWNSPVAVMRGVAKASWFTDDRLAGHDIVMIDTRGQGRTGPDTSCPELADYNAEINTRHLQPAGLAAVKACLAKFENAPIPLSAVIDDAAAANDVMTARRALGIDSWSIYSARELADIAMHLLAVDGSAVSAVMAFVPYAVGFGPTPNSENEAFHRLALDCAAQPTCAAKGDLNALMDELVTKAPVTASVVEPKTGWPIVLDAAAYRLAIPFAMTYDKFGPLVPSLVAGAVAGTNIDVFAGYFQSTTAATDARALAQDCQALGYVSVPSAGGDDHAGPFAGVGDSGWCDEVGPIPQLPAAPKSTGSIPVLVETSSYEYQSTETSIKALFSGYPNLTVVTSPQLQSLAPDSVACFNRLLHGFVGAPSAALDTSCWTIPTSMAFT